MRRDSIPIACSLSTIDAATQALNWRILGRHASKVDRVDRGFAATFPIDLAEAVEDLAAREAACCGFLSIRTARTDRGVRLEITSSDPNAMPVVEALATAFGP